MSEKRIRSFALKSKSVSVVYNLSQIESGESTEKKRTDEVFREPSYKVRTCLKVMLGHALIIAGLANGKLQEQEMKSRKIIDLPVFKDYNVIGFKTSKDDKDLEISFKITKTCPLGGLISFETPSHKISSDHYSHSDLLTEDYNNLIQEIELFVEGENYTDQLSMFSTEESEIQEEEL